MSMSADEIKELLEKQLETGYKAAASGKTLEEAKEKTGLTGETA